MKSSALSAATASFFLFTFASALTIDCSHIRVDQISFDFSKLSGPHYVQSSNVDKPPAIFNTTWTLDICQPLTKDSDLKNGEQCPAGTRVCGTVRSWNPVEDPDKKHVQVDNVIPIAGNFETTGSGKSLNPTWTRLKKTNPELEGLQLELYGGIYNRKKQMAVINFECDKERTGNEGSVDKPSVLLRRDEGEDEDDGKQNSNSSLTFVSYGSVESMDVLRLNWRTKHACEDVADDEDEVKKPGWGFFTWFILILFLGISAYLIFGSWLNYNRYGARGWDLLPHGDTIRDVPYLFKDWSRKVVDTVQGGGARGGYSAV